MIPRLNFFLRFALVCLLSGLLLRASAATCSDTACVEIGARLASVDSQRSILLNALLGNLLGTTVSLQAVDWQALTNANVNLLDLLQALQAQASLGTPQAAVDTSVDLLKVLNATATALQAEGNTAAATAVYSIAARVPSGMIKLGDLLDLCSSCLNYADVSLNVLDLVMGEVDLFNFNNMLTTPTPITISGSALGLGSLGTIQLYAQIIESPRIVCRAAGAQFYGASIRLKLDVALPTVTLTAALATNLANNSVSLTNVAGVTLQLTHLSLYADVARAQGSIQTIDGIAKVVTLQAVPGIANVYLGAMDDAVFFNRYHTLSAATDLQYGTVGSLGLSVLGIPLTVGVKARAVALGQAPFYTGLTFSGTFPQSQTVSTSAQFVNNLVGSLVSSLDIQFDVSGLGVLTTLVTNTLNTALGLLKAPVVAVYGVAINPLLSSLLGSVVNPVLCLLGVNLGEAYVTVLGARRRCTYTLSGTVYRDSNRNGYKDGSETGTGLTLYAKLISETATSGPASQAVAVDPATGAFSFSGLASGSYRIAIDDNATLTDVTPCAVPAGWLATEQGNFLRTGIAVTSDLPNLNFGLIDGGTVSGKVFLDTGTGGGTANDGIRNGGEAGLGNVALNVLNATGTVLGTATSAADGTYQLFIPAATTTGAILRVVETNPSGDLSTGASIGTTGGTYVRTTDTVTFTYTAGTAYTGVDFGDAPPPQLITQGQQTTLPGTTVYYPHRFVATSTGSVTFSATHTLEPVVDGWTEIVYLDSNGNGQLDAGEPVLTGATAVTENQTLNVIVKVFAPVAAGYGARNQTVLRADFTFTGATPALTQSLTQTDLTLVGTGGAAGVTLTKAVDKTSAKPGDTITYTITFMNESPVTLRNIVVSDVTPAFTRFTSAGVSSSPASLGTATITAPTANATGAIRWTFPGDLAAGASGVLVFAVTIEQ